VNIDTADKLASALPVFLPLIVGLALLLLLLVFRSLFVPVKAVLGFLLTIAASFGVVVWIFQSGHLDSLFGIPATAPVTSFLPIIMIAILFGLAMDYEVFLVSRMRESYLRTDHATEAMALVGARAWHLPKWLDRRVPDLDVEGEQLMEQLDRG
jgi:RND superfamily putative drug exporter